MLPRLSLLRSGNPLSTAKDAAAFPCRAAACFWHDIAAANGVYMDLFVLPHYSIKRRFMVERFKTAYFRYS